MPSSRNPFPQEKTYLNVKVFKNLPISGNLTMFAVEEKAVAVRNLPSLCEVKPNMGVLST